MKKFKKLLLIGGNGYIGCILQKELKAARIPFCVIDSQLPPKSLSIKTPMYNMCIRNNNMSKNLLSKIIREEVITHVINLSGMVGEPQCNIYKKDVTEMNVNVPCLIATVCKEIGIKLIHISTCSVYGYNDAEIADEDSKLNPIGVYGKSKIESERAINKLSDFLFRPIILRFGTVFGYSPRMRFDLSINKILYDCVQDNEFTIYGGKQCRPFLYIHSACKAIIDVLDHPTTDTFNISDENMSFNMLSERISSRLKHCTGFVKDDKDPDPRSYVVSTEKYDSLYTKGEKPMCSKNIIKTYLDIKFRKFSLMHCINS